MPVVDIVVVVLMGAGFLIGILRGFLLQVTGLVGLLGGGAGGAPIVWTSKMTPETAGFSSDQRSRIR